MPSADRDQTLIAMHLAVIAFLVGLVVVVLVKRPDATGSVLFELLVEALSWALFWW